MKLFMTLFALMFSFSTFAADPVEPTLADFGPQQKITNSSLDIIAIETTSFNPSGEMGTMASIAGDVIGLEYAPAGDYRVRIVNGNGFKAPRFSLMMCTLKSYIEDLDGAMEDSMILSTAFTDMNGGVHNALGYYSGANAYPSDGYKVIVVNGQNVQFWNSMNCRIK